MGWQPIETAPKDGSPVLGVWQCLNQTWDYNVVQFSDDVWWNYYFDGSHTPTHWMPLPEPPK
jgi:hypothetical protein